MFYSIYKTTLKNIRRSAIFWMLIVLLGIFVWQRVAEPAYTIYLSTGETIFDTDPRFVLGMRRYVQEVSNICGSLLSYIVPLFTTVSTVLTLNRDLGDRFFEIEKAAGISPIKYVAGRFCAILSLNVIILTLASYLILHLYVFTRGGVDGVGVWEYICDSTVRMARHIIFRGVPAIVFYIGFTYCIGNIFKNGIAAAVASISYILFNYRVGVVMFGVIGIPTYWNYFSHNPRKLSNFFHYYDHSSFNFMLRTYDTNLTKAVICICLLVGSGLIYSVISYLCTRVRDK